MLALSKPFKILFEGNTITCVFHAKTQVLEVSFYGYTQSKELKASFTMLLNEYGKSFTVKNWFFDLKYMHAQPDDLDWLLKDWHKAAIKKVKAPFKVAYIPAVNFVANHQIGLYLQEQKSKCKSFMTLEVSEFEEAEKWF